MEIEKAIKHLINMRDGNMVTLDKFKKEIEQCKDSSTHYSTLVYDNRHAYYCLAIQALREMQGRDSEPKPLTLEELQERDGKEVYCCWKTKREIIDWDIENPHKAKVNVLDESVSNIAVKHYFDQYGTRFIAYDRQPGEGARG